MELDTAFTRKFDLRVPLVQAPMGGVSGPALVAAAAEAGALGILPVWFLPVEQVGAVIEATRALTRRPFAVNLRADLMQHEHARAAVEAGVRVVHLFWGDPGPVMQRLQQQPVDMIATVWDADSTRRALDAGACGLIAQGVEAGGHVRGTWPLARLLPVVRELAGEVPVAAAGGLADANDVAEVLGHGADAAVLGTRLAATAESAAHEAYKQALIDAGDDATVLSECFDVGWPEAPHRTLRNSTFVLWDEAGRPSAGVRPGVRPGEGDVVLREPDGPTHRRYSVVPPARGMSGEFEAAALYSGTGVGRIRGVPSVAALIKDLMDDLAARAPAP